MILPFRASIVFLGTTFEIHSKITGDLKMISQFLLRGLGMTTLEKSLQTTLQNRGAKVLATYAEIKTMQSLYEDGKLAADAAVTGAKKFSKQLDSYEFDEEEFKRVVILQVDV